MLNTGEWNTFSEPVGSGLVGMAYWLRFGLPVPTEKPGLVVYTYNPSTEGWGPKDPQGLLAS